MTTSDLTMERLDELEEAWRHIQWPTAAIRDEMHTLIAMARAKQAAERERDAYMALADTKAAEVAALEAERDILREMGESLMAVWLDVRAAVNGKPLAEIQAALAQSTDAGGVE